MFDVPGSAETLVKTLPASYLIDNAFSCDTGKQMYNSLDLAVVDSSVWTLIANAQSVNG
jgi:hypothetical protein